MDRSKSKMINYGIVYGLSDYGLADRLNIAREEAKAFIDAYLERFSRVAAFMATTIEEAKERGYVTTLFGRRRQIPELRARNYQVRTLGERLAVNTVIQGTAADVMKLAMIGVHRALAASGLQTRMILTIHDELLFEGPPEEAERGQGARRARDDRAVGRPDPAAGRRRGRRASPGWRRSSDGPRGRGGPDGDRRRVHRAAVADQRAAGPARSARCRARSCRSPSARVVLLVAAALARGGLGRIGDVGDVNVVYLTGGMLGAGYVTAALVASARWAPAA